MQVVTLGQASSIRLDWDGDRARGKVIVRNDSGKPLIALLRMTAVDRLGNAVTVTFDAPKTPEGAGFEIDSPKEAVIPLKVKVSPSCGRPLFLPVRGRLEGVSRPSKNNLLTTVFGPTEVFIPEKSVPGMAGSVFVGSLLLAGATVVLVAFKLKSKSIHPLGTMGGTTWNFQQSWGSNVTIASGLLSALLTATYLTFPEHPHLMPRGSYGLLQSLFMLLLPLAPLAYGLLSRDVQVQVSGPGGASVAHTESQGYIVMYLLAGGLILWAALGQAATLLLLLIEFLIGNMIDVLIGGILVALIGLLILLLAVYGWSTLSKVASRPGATIPPGGGAAPVGVPPGGGSGPPPPKPSLREGAILSDEDQALLPPPAPEWPLL
jgi:hypothetical protein